MSFRVGSCAVVLARKVGPGGTLFMCVQVCIFVGTGNTFGGFPEFCCRFERSLTPGFLRNVGAATSTYELLQFGFSELAAV